MSNHEVVITSHLEENPNGSHVDLHFGLLVVCANLTDPKGIRGVLNHSYSQGTIAEECCRGCSLRACPSLNRVTPIYSPDTRKPAPTDALRWEIPLSLDPNFDSEGREFLNRNCNGGFVEL